MLPLYIRSTFTIRKKIGIILMIIGIYFTIAIPIMSIILNRVYKAVPEDPLSYIMLWFTEFGWFAIYLALIGIIFISWGYSMLKNGIKREFFTVARRKFKVFGPI